MKFLAVITLLILAITLAQPVAAQSFKPDYEVGDAAYDRKDYATALKHLRPLAEQGHARAQYRLGDIYSGGWGVTEDDAEAVRWYRKAAEQGHAKAQFWLGIMYYQGHGVTRDYKEAVRWCRKAAKQGDAYAQFWLGDMYKQGIGDLQDGIMAYV
jgi:TPR repeat protein